MDLPRMDLETSCPSCHGTGDILAPYDPRPGYPAHAYAIVCGCGILMERHPHMGALGYQAGQTMPWITHQQALARAAGYVAWVDELLRADIEHLWGAGIETFSSCQGKDGAGRWIVLRRKQDAARARELLPWVTHADEHGGGARLEEKDRSE